MDMDMEAALAALKRPRGRPPKHASYVQMGSASNGIKHRPIRPRPVDDSYDSWSPSKEERSQIQGAMDILAARNISVVPVMNPAPRAASPPPGPAPPKTPPEYDDADHDPDMDFAPMFCEVIVGQTDGQAPNQGRLDRSGAGLSITPRVVLGSPPRLDKCYRCDLCPRSYSSRAGLWYHKKAHSGNKQYSCNVCFKRFSQKSHLEVHMKYHRSKGQADLWDSEGRPEGSVDGEGSAEGSADVDARRSRPSDEEDCGEVEDAAVGAEGEMEVRRRSVSPEKQHDLPDDGVGNRQESPHDSPRDSPRDGQRLSQRPSASDLNFAQMFVDPLFRNEDGDVAGGAAQQAIRHGSARYNDLIISAIPSTMPPPEPRTLQPAQIQALLAKGPKLDKCYKCELCSNTYSSRAGLWYHRKTHSGNKQYACRVCTQSFTQKGHLQAHMRTHEMERPYACTHCDATFSDPANLENHLYTHAPGDSPFQCRQCGERFTRQLQLIQHERTHAVNKPLKCPHCERSFAHKNNLVNHMRVHRSS